VPYILKARAKKPFSSLDDFCQRVDLHKVNKRVIESLIKAGAFDSLKVKRSQLMFILQEVMEKAQRKQRGSKLNQLSLFDLSETEVSDKSLPMIDEWTEDVRLNYEKEALGFYLTGHPLHSYEQTLKELSNTNTEEITNLADRTPVMLGGIITALKEINSKKGERMAFATLEDIRGKIEVVIFSNLYREARDYFRQEQPLFISGHISKDENTTKVIAEKVYFLAEAKEKLRKPKKIQDKKIKIVLKEGEIDSNQLLTLKDILKKHKGKCSVYLEIFPQETLVALPYYLYVNPSQEFVRSVNELLGYQAVEIK